MKIGVLALHGAFIEHIQLLESMGIEAARVRLPEDLADVDGLIIPGGESTTMRKLTARWGMRQPILDLAASGAPVLGTCAGMIVVANEIAGGEEPVFPMIDVTVRRNAFGRQLDSFETDLAIPAVGGPPVHAIFIRAPIIERVGPGVEVLAALPDGRVVAVRQRNVVAISFHPELAGETRIHRLIVSMAADKNATPSAPGGASARRVREPERAHKDVRERGTEDATPQSPDWSARR